MRGQKRDNGNPPLETKAAKFQAIHKEELSLQLRKKALKLHKELLKRKRRNLFTPMPKRVTLKAS